MRKLTTYGTIKQGKLKISYRDRFVQNLSLFSDCRILLTVEKLYKRRSTRTENGLGQNGYYHAIICQDYRKGAYETQQRVITGEQAHEELKANCSFKEYYKESTGEVMKSIISTATMTTVEAEEYYQRCRDFILEWFGIDVPLPGEQGELDFKID